MNARGVLINQAICLKLMKRCLHAKQVRNIRNSFVQPGGGNQTRGLII